MSFIEFLGVLATIGMIAFLFIKQIYEQINRVRNPLQAAASDKLKHKQMRALLKSIDPALLDEEEEEEKAPPTLPVRQTKPPKKTAPLPLKRTQTRTPATESYCIESKTYRSRASALVHQLPTPRNMFLYKEIVGQPKALSAFSEDRRL
jgi:hypothetical protein